MDGGPGQVLTTILTPPPDASVGNRVRCAGTSRPQSHKHKWCEAINMSRNEPAVTGSAHARSNMTTQVFGLTGEAKNKPPRQHLPTLAQRFTVFPCWALLITQQHRSARAAPAASTVGRASTILRKHKDLLCVCARQKQLWVINTRARMDGHKHTRMWMCTDRERHSSCSWAEGQNIPDSCEFLWRKDGGRMERWLLD